MTAEVIVVGAGPTGLLLACELSLSGVRPVVLERQPRPRDLPKANGLAGQIVQLLHYRGLLARLSAAGSFTGRAPGFPFGGMGLDFSGLPESPLQLLLIPQPRLEQLLGERAEELGVEIRRGHEVSGVRQDAAGVAVQVCGPDGEYRLDTSYLVGCDGGRSPVRMAAGIEFPGTTYPEVTRLGHVAMPDSVTRLDNGDLEVPGVGLVQTGFTRTERGVLAFASFTPDVLLVSVTEEDPTAVADRSLTLSDLEAAIHRVLGTEVPLGEPIWLSSFTAQARQADRYRAGRILLAGDAAHLFPAGGAGLNVGLTDALNLGWKLAGTVQGWASPGLLDTYQDERWRAGARALMQTRAQTALAAGTDDAAALRAVFGELLRDEQATRRIGEMLAGTDLRYPMPGADSTTSPLIGGVAPDLPLRTDSGVTSVAELLHAGRPVLLDLVGPEGRLDLDVGLREVAAGWANRVDYQYAQCEHGPATALLIRPDGLVAWAESADGSGAAVQSLPAALTHWFGEPQA
ncbi:FAD-dependent monooxygenase [Nocardia sp. NPDC051756]|uniref:FAD-dependent monooxygenase n=1 Tax=Nocardia sp. NPDC051756 TaxID=3154751 RepID=UPI003431DE63